MSMLLIATLLKPFEGAARHTCAVGGVDPTVTPSQNALACQEIRMG